MTFEIVITKEYDDIKPKNFLKKKIDLPYYKIVKLIANKRITLNKKKIKDDSILREGDIIKVWLDDVKLREVKQNHSEMKDLGLGVVYDCEDFVVFNKLSDVIVQGAQDNSNSLSLHLAYYKNKLKDVCDFEYFHAHRLDKDTSGCLVVAKTRKALRDFNEIFRNRNVTKKYLCLCCGKFKEKTGKVDVFMKRNPEGSREKMSVVKVKDADSKKSLSYYNIVREINFNNEIFTLVEVEIKTGLTHQIRVHMKHLGHRIVGDSMYGNSFVNKQFGEQLSRQFLHASSLSFKYLEKEYNFKAELTNDLEEFLKFLDKKE